MTHLTIGGETFNVRIEGDAALPVVVLSHALGTDLHLWDDQMPGLLEHFRVVRYDSRGHGGSLVGPESTSIARLGQDALAILDALDLDKVHWIGVSMGGLVGQWLLVNAPDRIERAVLANTAAQFGPPQGWNARIVAAKHKGLAALAEDTLARWFSPGFAQKKTARVKSVEKMFLATQPSGYAAACAALRDADLREDLRRIDHPVLIIAGVEDASITPAQTSLLVDTIPNATLVSLNARHISNIEAADAFNKAVLNFLTGKLARRPKTRPTTPPLPAPRRPAGRRSPATRGTMVEARPKRAPVPVAKAEKAKAAPARSKAPKTAKTTPIKTKAGFAKTPVIAAPARKATPTKTSRKDSIAPTTRLVTKATAKKTTRSVEPVRAKLENTATKATAAKASAKAPPANKKRVAKKAASVAAKLKTSKPATKKGATAKVTAAPARKTASRAKTTIAASKQKTAPTRTPPDKTAPAKAKTGSAKVATAKVAVTRTTRGGPAAPKKPAKKPVAKPLVSRRK